MKIFSVIVGITTMLCSQYVYCQDAERGLSFNVGLNLAHPTLIFFNQESFKKSIPAYQLSFNKEFVLSKALGVGVSVGLNRNSFNAGRQRGNIYSIKQLDLYYLSLEVGPSYKIPLKKVTFWCAPNIRVSRLIKQNFDEHFGVTSLSSADIGLNSQVGIKVTTVPMRPYLLLNYYHGLMKTTTNSLVTGDGLTLDDYMRNRSMGIQVGFHF